MKRYDKLIAKFMGLQSVRIGYYGTDDETKWQTDNKSWLDRPEISEQYGNSVGNYYVNVEKDIIIHQEHVDYKNNWNDLMPVVELIEKRGAIVEIFIALTFGCRITASINSKPQSFINDNNGGLPAITGVYKSSVEFIKWYNKNKKP